MTLRSIVYMEVRRAVTSSLMVQRRDLCDGRVTEQQRSEFCCAAGSVRAHRESLGWPESHAKVMVRTSAAGWPALA